MSSSKGKGSLASWATNYDDGCGDSVASLASWAMTTAMATAAVWQ